MLGEWPCLMAADTSGCLTLPSSTVKRCCSLRTCALRHRIELFWTMSVRLPPTMAPNYPSRPFAKGFAFAYHGRSLEYLHGRVDSVLLHSMGVPCFFLHGFWFWVFGVYPTVGRYWVAWCISCIVSISRVCGRTRAQGRVFNDLLLYKYNNIYLFIKRVKNTNKT